jgi:hypothetical protein
MEVQEFELLAQLIKAQQDNSITVCLWRVYILCMCQQMSKAYIAGNETTCCVKLW